MEREILRRSFLKKSVIALGTLAVFDFKGNARAKQMSSPTILSEEELKKIKEDKNPHVIVKLFPGRTEQQKRRLADAIVKAVVDIIGGSEGSVSVAVEEIKSEDWKEKVYKPDILDKWDRLYKKPGYSM